MKRMNAFACCISILLLARTGFACDYPKRPDVPNGSAATKDEMIAGQKGIKQYLADLEAYQQCLVDDDKAERAKIEEITPEADKQREAVLTKKYNAAQDDMVKAAAAFNAELQEYNANSTK